MPLVCLLSLLFLLGCGDSESDAAVAARFDAEGRLERPGGYRSWIHVGAPLTPNSLNDGHAAFPEFHSVYVDPASYQVYRESGVWRDGTVFLKELVSVGAEKASSGRGYFMGEFLGLEASVKSAEQFPDAPGNWGYFRFTDEEGGPPKRVAAPLPVEACSACHQQNAAEDLVFTQFYPVLRAARGRRDTPPEDL